MSTYHYDETRFELRPPHVCVPENITSIDDLPRRVGYIIRRAHTRAGYDGAIDILVAEPHESGWFRVVTQARRKESA